MKKNNIFDVKKLINYIKKVIIVNSNNLERQTLAFLIFENINIFNCKLTKIATWLSIGDFIDYADENIISATITLRK